MKRKKKNRSEPIPQTTKKNNEKIVSRFSFVLFFSTDGVDRVSPSTGLLGFFFLPSFRNWTTVHEVRWFDGLLGFYRVSLDGHLVDHHRNGVVG